jgi:predicted nucleotidyltransferase
MTTDMPALLKALTDARVEFVLIGGVAANVHGSARVTYDLDVVYARDDANIARLVAAMRPLQPYLRGAPPGLPFRFDSATVRAGLNFTLTTTAGAVDLLGEVAGGGTFETLKARSSEADAYGVRFRCVDLPTLIHLKRAAGRPKDLDAVAELEKLRVEQRGG